jgi:hypothetical protein
MSTADVQRLTALLTLLCTARRVMAQIRRAL